MAISSQADKFHGRLLAIHYRRFGERSSERFINSEQFRSNMCFLFASILPLECLSQAAVKWMNSIGCYLFGCYSFGCYSFECFPFGCYSVDATCLDTFGSDAIRLNAFRSDAIRLDAIRIS